MGIIVPNSTPIMLAADEINGEYYQNFIITDNNGNSFTQSNPFPTQFVVSGYSSTAVNYQGAYMPIGGVYINDLTGTDFSEMSDGESATVRMNNRRAIMTASDGQVTTLTEAQTNNYHDTVVASGVTFDGVTVPAYGSFFAYAGQQLTRYVYIPLSKSGWKRLNLYIKHDLTNDSDSQPTPLGVNLYADFGQFTNDYTIINDTISGVAGSMAGRLYSCVTPTNASNTVTHIPELDSPLAGIIISLTNSEAVTGNVEIYASKSS